MGWRVFNQMKDGRSYGEVAAMPDMPDMDTIEKWLDAEPHFQRLISLARGCQAQDMVNEIKGIADNANPSNQAEIDKARLQCEVRMWLAERLYPSMFAVPK